MNIYNKSKKKFNFMKDSRVPKNLHLCADLTKEYEKSINEMCPDYFKKGLFSDSINAFMQDFVESPEKYEDIVNKLNE